jgi:hypothetical protein
MGKNPNIAPRKNITMLFVRVSVQERLSYLNASTWAQIILISDQRLLLSTTTAAAI